MSKLSRRDFLKTTALASGVLASGRTPLVAAAKKSATDWVTLGNSGVKVTRLAFGTGTYGGRVQREMGQEQFTKVVRHAYDRGIRFFETADAYRGMPQMLSTALQGIPRDSYKLMTKFRVREGDDPKATISRMLKDLNTDHVDIMLLHCVRTATWPDELKRLRDELSEAKSKKLILAHGASCHGLLPLRAFSETKWLEVGLVRINHNGTRMDTLKGGDAEEKGDVNQVVSNIKKIHEQGAGVLGMKLMGEGRFTNPEDRDASLKFVLGLGNVDAFTLGMKSAAEVDEAIERINKQLNA